MLAMGQEVGGDYEWEAGTERPAGSPIPIPYLGSRLGTGKIAR
jgi:hypothetical protein